MSLQFANGINIGGTSSGGGGGGSANIESLSVTPITSDQTITATGGVDGYSPISVSAVTSSIDSNIQAENIKKDVTILGVTGTLQTGSAVANIVCSHNTSWLLKTDGTLWGCGYNYFGQQGSGNTSNVSEFTQRLTDVKFVACSDSTTWAIKTDDTLWSCGSGLYGVQGSGDTSSTSTFTQRLTNVAEVKCSASETWALKKDGSLWGCGYNNFGQQGSDSTSNVLSFTKRMTDVVYFTLMGLEYGGTTISSSLCQIWVLKSDGTLWHAGNNGYGQGGNSTNPHKVFTQIASINS